MCDGSFTRMDQAFVFTRVPGGLCAEEDYPYVGKKEDTCRSSSCGAVEGTKVKEYVDILPGSEANLMNALAHQPVSIGIQANSIQFQLYKRGVFDSEKCGVDVDHGVLAVGYGTDKRTGKHYWKVKNSWGNNWGDDGYFLLDRESSEKMGICGILTMPSHPGV